MKVGDTVICNGKEGEIVRFQPKTQDLIVKDKEGKIHIFCHFKSEVLNAPR